MHAANSPYSPNPFASPASDWSPQCDRGGSLPFQLIAVIQNLLDANLGNVESPTPAFLATAAIAQVARPEIVAWAETRRPWIEKRAADLIAMRDFDKFHARSVLARDIVISYEAEIASGRTES